MMHPVFHLVAILTGIFLFHAGWNGKAALIVQLTGKGGTADLYTVAKHACKSIY
jgi:hypothetical protein